jgi:hypothetical protein
LIAVRLWAVDQRLREAGAYLEVVAEAGRLSVVLPGQASRPLTARRLNAVS